eukprot:6497119-Pyramimonas_sp.AAC.1
MRALHYITYDTATSQCTAALGQSKTTTTTSTATQPRPATCGPPTRQLHLWLAPATRATTCTNSQRKKTSPNR